MLEAWTALVWRAPSFLHKNIFSCALFIAAMNIASIFYAHWFVLYLQAIAVAIVLFNEMIYIRLESKTNNANGVLKIFLLCLTVMIPILGIMLTEYDNIWMLLLFEAVCLVYWIGLKLYFLKS